MTPEQKRKLFIDLSGRLPYGVKCLVKDEGEEKIATLSAVYSNGGCCFHELIESDKGFDSIKPIYHPFSDLTNKIKHNGEEYLGDGEFSDFEWEQFKEWPENLTKILSFDSINELLKRHFDINNLIGDNLAISTNDTKMRLFLKELY